MRWTNRRILITLVGMVVVFTALMATRYEFSRPNEYLPAVFLKPNGEPFSLPIKDKPVVVMSGWGTPIGFNKAYDDYIFWRTSGGVRITEPNQACSQWHSGTFPYQIEMARVPFAVGRKVEGFEKFWDSRGAYKISEDGQRYDPIITNKAGEFPFMGGDAQSLKVSDLEGVEILPLKDYVSGITRKYGPDPRSGIDYLAGTYLINQANGVNDFYEIDKAYRPRIYGMMGWDPDKPAYFPDYKKDRDKILKDYIKGYFGNQIEVTEGFYSPVPGLSKHLKDTMPRIARKGYRKVVLTKPITDHNLYANNYWDLHLSYQSLCRAGFDKDDIELSHIRMYGRTPEYNHILYKNLHRHLDLIDPEDEVAVIYATFGAPWPGANPVGPMSNSTPFINEFFHENAYLNFLSIKRYIEEHEKNYNISFIRTGGNGSVDARTNNLFAYTQYSPDKLGYPDDPLRYWQVRESIEDAILNQGKKEVVVMLSHWGYTFWILITNMRETWDIPLNTIEEIQNGEYRMTWCEKYQGPGDYEQVAAVNNQCPSGFTRLQLTEAFEDQMEDLAFNYANRIRGGLERFGVFPNLDINIVASGEITILEGGSVAVNEGPLAGAKLDVPKDPQPGKPGSYQWENRWRPESDPNPNTGPDAVRAINEYAQTSDYLDGPKDDFTAVIGTQAKRTPEESMPEHPKAVSPTIFFGPYRTLFNAPATITLPYDDTRVTDPKRIRPYVFNEVTQKFEVVPKVMSNREPHLSEDNSSLTFQVQILGQFVLVEES